MSKVTLYHNPRCSKSRATLALLQEKGIEPVIVHYLDTLLDAATLKKLQSQLGVNDIRQLMRTNDVLYKNLQLDQGHISQSTLLQALMDHPQLLERPIVVANNQARIGRPPENVLSIL